MAYSQNYNVYNTFQVPQVHNFPPPVYEAVQQPPVNIDRNGFYDQSSEYICDICQTHNFSGSVFHCTSCMGGNFDMCEPCRTQGRSCSCVQANNVLHLIVVPGQGRKYYSPNGERDIIDLEIPLSDLLPSDISIRNPSDNPAIRSYCHRFSAYTAGHTNPPYETASCSNPAEYELWESRTYRPQRAYYEQQISCLNDLLKELINFAKFDSRSGSKGWEYQTQDGEMVDALDLIFQVMIKVEKTYKEMSDLTDEMNGQWAAAEVKNAQAMGNTEHVTACEKWYSTVIREEALNFGKGKYDRMSETLRDVEEIVRRGEALEKYTYDSVLEKLTAEVNLLRAGGQSLSTHDERKKALDVLAWHYDTRQKLLDRIFQIRQLHIRCYLTYRIAETPENEASVKSECENSLSGAVQLKDNALRTLSDEYDNRLSRTLIPAVSSFSTIASSSYYSQDSTQALASSSPLPQYNQLAAPPQYSAQAGTTFAAQPNSLAVSSLIPPVPNNSATSASSPAPSPNPPRYQMPLSWYSNMLTQQHVTNMNVINNIAGGNTTYSAINPLTGIKYY